MLVHRYTYCWLRLDEKQINLDTCYVESFKYVLANSTKYTIVRIQIG